MFGLFSKASITITAKGLLMSLMLSGVLPMLQASSVTNGLELGLAFATIPFDSAARRNDLAGNKKRAAAMHLATDVLSLANKGFFFYNNYHAHEGQFVVGRDTVVNGAWLIRDVTRIMTDWKKYQEARDTVKDDAPVSQLSDNDFVVLHDDINDELFTAFDEISSNDQKELDAEKVVRWAYVCQVIVLPCLRGLSACVLALTQAEDAGGIFEDEQIRYLTTAIHSFVRLSQEYTDLETDSPYKKIVAGALIVNALWLAKEIKDYYCDGQKRLMRRIRRMRGEDARVPVGDANQAEWQDIEQLLALDDEQAAFRGQLRKEAPTNFLMQQGKCESCLDDESQLVQLHCGHALFCMECLGGYVAEAIKNRKACVMCPNKDCKHQAEGVAGGLVDERRFLKDGEVRAIIQVRNLDMNRYDLLRARSQRGARPCSTDDCPHVLGNPHNRRINIYSCPECRQQYCSHCTVPHDRGISCMRARIEAIPGTRQLLDESENKTLCPSCFTICNRENACPNMICTEERCQRNFCLYCHQAPGNHTAECMALGLDGRFFSQTPDGRRAARN